MSGRNREGGGGGGVGGDGWWWVNDTQQTGGRRYEPQSAGGASGSGSVRCDDVTAANDLIGHVCATSTTGRTECGPAGAPPAALEYLSRTY